MKNKENKNYKKRIEKGFIILTHARSQYEVWSDLMLLYANSLVNNCTLHYKEHEKLKSIWEEREKQYIDTINKYNEKEQKIIVQMFSLLVLEYEQHPYQDLLGEIYMMLGISSKNNGQFFTPFNVCDCMSELTFDKKTVAKTVHEKGYVSINDPSCGGGATLISSAKQCDILFKKLNYKNHVLFVGQDIDLTCVRMCYIQLSLLGLAGYVLHGNTLTKPEFDFFKDNKYIYPTPYYNMDVWQGRIMAHGLDMLMEEKING